MRQICFAIFVTLMACGPVAVMAKYCKELPGTEGKHCLLTILPKSPDFEERPPLLESTLTEYCATDGFDGEKDCVLLAGPGQVQDAALDFQRSPSGTWLLNFRLQLADPESLDRLVRLRVDDHGVVDLPSVTSGRSSRGNSAHYADAAVRIEHETLEQIAKAETLVWFRFKLKGGELLDLKMEPWRFAYLEEFIAEADSVIGQ